MTNATELKKQIIKVEDKTILSLKVSKESGKTKLYLRASEEMENLFYNEVMNSSENYLNDGTALKYYALPSQEIIEQLNSLMDNIRIDSFGSSFVLSYDKLNFSILRSVGISKGIVLEINRFVSEEQLVNWATHLKEFVVKLYKNYVRKIEITVLIEKKEVF